MSSTSRKRTGRGRKWRKRGRGPTRGREKKEGGTMRATNMATVCRLRPRSVTAV